MKILDQIALFLRITGSHTIARRYFVVNGFDGALTMLGLITGFYISGGAGTPVIIAACLGAAVALTVSGLTSAYLSELAERQQALHELETAMVSDLAGSAHGKAARFIPALIALVNGLAPLLLSLLIISPLWLADHFPIDPLPAAIGVAMAVIFLLGVFLGSVGGGFWLWSGLRTLLIALATFGIILLIS
jgi:predicted membrane protein (TIGR00267 family)